MKKIYSLFLILLIAVSCYEDKGNYNYRSTDELTIERMDLGDNKLEVTVGEDIIVKTIITPDVTTDPSRYTFKWTLNNETRPEWNKKDFIWTADRPTPLPLTTEPLVLEVTDTRYGAKYLSRVSVNINPEFISEHSYLILTEDENRNSKLHFLKYLDFEKRIDPVDPDESIYFPIDVKTYMNVYEKQNENKSLGKGPLFIQEHYVKWPPAAQYCIFQESGAVDIEYEALKKDGDFSASFEDGSYPKGVEYLRSGSIMKWFDVMSDQKGRLFSRYKFDVNLFNTGTFLKKPMEYNGELLEDCTVFRTNYDGDYGFNGSFIFDKKNGRFFLIFDGGIDYLIAHKYAGKIMPVPAPDGGMPDDCRSYDDFKDCEILAVNVEYGGNYDLCIVYKDENGEVTLQVTDLEQLYGEPIIVNHTTENHKIADIPTGVSKVCMPKLYNQSCIFFVVRNKVYLTDINSKNYKAELYYTAESDITSLNLGGANGDRTVILGTVDGFIHDIDVSGAKNKISSKVTDEEKLVYKAGGFGKIVDINYCQTMTH